MKHPEWDILIPFSPLIYINQVYCFLHFQFGFSLCHSFIDLTGLYFSYVWNKICTCKNNITTMQFISCWFKNVFKIWIPFTPTFEIWNVPKTSNLAEGWQFWKTSYKGNSNSANFMYLSCSFVPSPHYTASTMFPWFCHEWPWLHHVPNFVLAWLSWTTSRCS